MNTENNESKKSLNIRHPLIRQVAEMIADVTGSRLLIVYPQENGWGQTHGDAQTHLQPSFCKLIKGSRDGAKNCRTCHTLMAVAACNDGPMVQRCHAGASVLVCPASKESDPTIAVLSSCIFGSDEKWEDVRRQGEELGIDPEKLREAFTTLPHLDENKLRLLRSGMQAMSQAIQVVRQNEQAQETIGQLHKSQEPGFDLERFLKTTDWATGRPSDNRSEGSLLIHVVCEMIRQRPDLPLSVKELAAAARLTPNHFSTLFREHAGCTFTQFLTEQRISRAQKLLKNPTIPIGEIAELVGYDDPAYFARRFHKATGLSPRDWRNQQAESNGNRERHDENGNGTNRLHDRHG
jgi:AraC-like DNA-binding protein/ligand-binding sensor protein